MKKSTLLPLLLCLLALGLHAQQMPLNPSATQALEAELMQGQVENFHSAIKPYNHFQVGHLQDSIQTSLRKDKEINSRFGQWFYNRLFNDHFVEIRDKESDKYSIIINPLADIRAGNASDLDALAFTNTRGIQVMGHIGKKFTYYTDFYENQARFPGYMNDYINQNHVVPGQGWPKNFNSQLTDESGFDFAYASSNLAYQPNEFFNFQVGRGKHFIGEGHRSFLLSDNAFNYPYFKITTSFWKLNYVNLFTQMRDIVGDNYSTADFNRKYVSSHYLSINATDRLNIGLFETIVYQQDSTQAFDINFLNPLILYRPLEFAIGSGDGNVLMGLTASYKTTDKSMLYMQFILDEFKFSEILAQDGWWANKYALQLGFKSYDTFTKGLKFQTEINYARPYTFTHGTTGRNYGHYNQPLGHTLGANFIESTTRLSYQKNRWFGELQIMVAVQGRDTLGSNWGADVFQSYNSREQQYGNETLQGVRVNTLFVDTKVGYLLNPKTNLRLELGLTYRSFAPETELGGLLENQTTFFHFGLRTALENLYHDF